MGVCAMFWALQGGLDLRYMADRYSKGKAFTTDFMATHQRYVSAREGLVDAHADILTWQSTVSGSGTGHRGRIINPLYPGFVCSLLSVELKGFFVVAGLGTPS